MVEGVPVSKIKKNVQNSFISYFQNLVVRKHCGTVFSILKLIATPKDLAELAEDKREILNNALDRPEFRIDDVWKKTIIPDITFPQLCAMADECFQGQGGGGGGQSCSDTFIPKPRPLDDLFPKC